MSQTTMPAPIRPYVGSGPYCYTNSLVAVLGGTAPSTAVVESVTGSPFGFQLLAGRLPLFDPYGWDPDIGLDQAIGFLGYTHTRRTFDSAAAAIAALADHLRDGPVLVGPVDMGLLLHQPGSDRASGADHFVVVLEVGDDAVTFHDPQGYPWASLPVDVFCEAWRGDEVAYLDEPYALRTDFRATADVTPLAAFRASLPAAAAWMAGRDLPVPPGTLGGREGLERLAEIVAEGLTDDMRGFLGNFALRVGARRKADAAYCLHLVGEVEAAVVFQEQARVLGALQFHAVRSDAAALAAGFRKLGGLHDAAAGHLGRHADATPAAHRQ